MMHKKNLVKNLETENFQFRSVKHRSNTNRVKQRAMIKNQEIFWNFEFFEKLHKIMQKQLNPNNFMNEMHETEFNVFQKHEFSTQNFKTRFLIIKNTIFANP